MPRGSDPKRLVWEFYYTQHHTIDGMGVRDMSEAKKIQTESTEVEKKWSKALTDAGWTAIPSVIFERQNALGLDSLDINIILHLAGYWWTADNAPHPSKATIAAAIGVHPRTIQRRITKLEGAGFIGRKARRSKKGGTSTNEYSFAGLIKAATPFALERIAEKNKRKAEATERAKRRKPQLTVVK